MLLRRKKCFKNFQESRKPSHAAVLRATITAGSKRVLQSAWYSMVLSSLFSDLPPPVGVSCPAPPILNPTKNQGFRRSRDEIPQKFQKKTPAAQGENPPKNLTSQRRSPSKQLPTRATAYERSIERTIKANLKLAHKAAHSWVGNCPEDYDELFQLAQIGLWKAARAYDPANRAKFTTFAYPWCVGEILHHLRSKAKLVKVPRLWREHYAKIRRIHRLRDGKFSYAEIARFLGIRNWPEILEACTMPPVLEITEEADEEKSGTVALAAPEPEAGLAPLTPVQIEAIHQALALMTEGDRHLFLAATFGTEPDNEIAFTVGCPPDRFRRDWYAPRARQIRADIAHAFPDLAEIFPDA